MPCLSKVLEKLVNNQLTGFLDFYSVHLGMQSGFRSGYGCVTATSIMVLNNVTIALDSKQCCATIFIDLAKAIDTIDHSILLGRLRSIGVSEGSFAWFANYLSQRVQFIKSKNLLSQPLPVTKGNTIHRSAGKGALERQDVLYHSAIRFATPFILLCKLVVSVYLSQDPLVDTYL